VFPWVCALLLDRWHGPGCGHRPLQGKESAEKSLWHTLYDNLNPGDISLADRCYSSYWELVLTKKRGAALVCRLCQRRRADFRSGRQLGKEDHVVSWSNPPRPKWMDQETYASLSEALEVREVRVHMRVPGFRTKVLVVVTTLLDPEWKSSCSCSSDPLPRPIRTHLEASGRPGGAWVRKSWGDGTAGLTPRPSGPPDAFSWGLGGSAFE